MFHHFHDEKYFHKSQGSITGEQPLKKKLKMLLA